MCMCFLPLLNFRKTFPNSSQCCRWLIVKCVYLARFLGHPFLGLLFFFLLCRTAKYVYTKQRFIHVIRLLFVYSIFLLSFFVVVAAVVSVIPNAKLLFLSIVIFTRRVCVCVCNCYFSLLYSSIIHLTHTQLCSLFKQIFHTLNTQY